MTHSHEFDSCLTENNCHVFIDRSNVQLIEQAILRSEGKLARSGAFLTTTGKRTGRSTADRFIVRDESTTDTVDWGTINQAFTQTAFDALWQRVDEHLQSRDRFVSHLHVGADLNHYLPICVTTETAWHSLFAANMFIQADPFNPDNKQQWQVLHAAHFTCQPARDQTHSDAVVILDFTQKKVLIAGMQYAGELKKSLFSVQNFLLPQQRVLPMHCSANVGKNGDTCLFFGLSGTGKTTLSADPQRRLIGDDEHGWSKTGVFNMEGGCYAKTIDLNPHNEPIIWRAIRFGSIVENVAHDELSRFPDYSDTSISENGRCSYPLEHIDDRVFENCGSEPQNLIFLTCDVMGVIPPIALLSKQAAAYHFISGYTARVGSTELGAAAGIHPTFSSCFGAPFMPRAASVYAELLIQRITESGARVYLVNTGWTGGSGGSKGTGKRFPIPVTRALISAIQSGALAGAPTTHLDILNLDVPNTVANIEPQFLNPRTAWQNPLDYDKTARYLANLFAENIKKFALPKEIIAAGPQEATQSN